MPAAERGALLGRLADLLEEERRTVALLEAANVGKPLFESLNFDLHQVIRSFRYFAGFADKYHGVEVPLNPEHLCFTSNLPLGPCALVMPFNFPLQLLCWKLAPALSVGCTIEANKFAEATDEYNSLGATVIGVSHDDIETLKKFSTTECRNKFAVGADTDQSVMKSYDAVLALKPDYANRTSYVISPEGKIVYQFTSLNPLRHVANTMAALKGWSAQKKQ